MKSVESVRRQQQRAARTATELAARGGNQQTARNRLRRISEITARYEKNMRNSNGGYVVSSPLNPAANGVWFTRQEYMGNASTAAKGGSAG